MTTAIRLAQDSFGYAVWRAVEPLDDHELAARGWKLAGPARILDALSGEECALLVSLCERPMKSLSEKERQQLKSLLERAPYGGWVPPLDIDVNDESTSYSEERSRALAHSYALALDREWRTLGGSVAWHTTNNHGGMHGDLAPPAGLHHPRLLRAFRRVVVACARRAGVPVYPDDMLDARNDKPARPDVYLDASVYERDVDSKGVMWRLAGAAKPGGEPKRGVDLVSLTPLAAPALPWPPREDVVRAAIVEEERAALEVEDTRRAWKKFQESGQGARTPDDQELVRQDKRISAVWHDTSDQDRSMRLVRMLRYAVEAGSDIAQMIRLAYAMPGSKAEVDERDERYVLQAIESARKLARPLREKPKSKYRERGARQNTEKGPSAAEKDGGGCPGTGSGSDLPEAPAPAPVAQVRDPRADLITKLAEQAGSVPLPARDGPRPAEWPGDPATGKGRPDARHQVLLGLAGWLRDACVPEALALAWVERLSVEDRDVVASTYERAARGERVAGQVATMGAYERLEGEGSLERGASDDLIDAVGRIVRAAEESGLLLEASEPDYERDEYWCRHKIERALAKRVEEALPDGDELRTWFAGLGRCGAVPESQECEHGCGYACSHMLKRCQSLFGCMHCGIQGRKQHLRLIRETWKKLGHERFYVAIAAPLNRNGPDSGLGLSGLPWDQDREWEFLKARRRKHRVRSFLFSAPRAVVSFAPLRGLDAGQVAETERKMRDFCWDRKPRLCTLDEALAIIERYWRIRHEHTRRVVGELARAETLDELRAGIQEHRPWLAHGHKVRAGWSGMAQELPWPSKESLRAAHKDEADLLRGHASKRMVRCPRDGGRMLWRGYDLDQKRVLYSREEHPLSWKQVLRLAVRAEGRCPLPKKSREKVFLRSKRVRHPAPT
jgi:hypothetical protein